MAIDAALPAAPRTAALARGLTARVALTGVVLVSFVVRVVASAAHPVPRLFPDEYLYTAFARSLAQGHGPAIRGVSAHFPALLAPLLAAPIQALAGPAAAFRLTQAENALLMSLAAVPVYLIARRLSVPAKHALLCAVFAVAIPDLVFSAYTISDPAAYPLVLAAVATGIAALDAPRRRTQLLFLAFAGLATFDRVQYVVLPVAFFAGAAFLDRRRVVSTQRLPLVLCGVPALGFLAIGASRVLGYYSNVTNLHVGGGVLRWAGSNLFLLAFACGVVIVPGALVALARPRGRAERAFSALTVALAVLLLFESSLFSANGSPRFHERYLFTLIPLVAVAFALYAKNGYPARRAVLLISGVLVVLAARLPLSGYVAGLGRVDSPFLNSLYSLQPFASTATVSLLVALTATLALGAAVAISRRGGASVALVAATMLLGLSSLGAAAQDAKEAQGVKRELVPNPATWVDDAHVGPVTLVQTQGAQQAAAVEQLYWNRSIEHELLLGTRPLPTDAYSAPQLKTTPDGHIVGVAGAVLFQGFGATVRFQNATVVAHAMTWSLWDASQGAPQLSLLEDGRFFDGWLSNEGRLTVWPDASGRVRGTLHFALTLPRTRREGVTIRFGKNSYHVLPGRVTAVEYAIDKRGPFSLAFSAKLGHWMQDLRHVSVESTAPVFLRAAGAQPAASATA